MNRRKAIAGIVGSVGALVASKEAVACGYDAQMSSNSSTNTRRVVAGINTCGGNTTVKLYNGGWGYLGSAHAPSGTAYLRWDAPATSQQYAYWVRVYRNGVKVREELFYRNYRF